MNCLATPSVGILDSFLILQHFEVVAAAVVVVVVFSGVLSLACTLLLVL